MKKHHFSIKIFLLFIFVSASAAPAFAKPPEWLRKVKRIELLKTTRVQIETLFDNPQIIEIEDFAVDYKNGWGKSIKYDTKYGKLEVWYGAGKCSESKGKPYAYDIAADVAAMVTFSPNDIVLENQLGYDLSKFKNDSNTDTEKSYSFETEKSKITITVENLQVSSFEYDISEKHKTQLECKNVTVKEPVWFEKLRTLKLFSSTQNEVEALFDDLRILESEDWDKDGDNWKVDVEYETIYGALEAGYSTGKCSERRSENGYDAARGTLVDLKFIPAGKFDATELNFDFRKIESDSTPAGVIKEIPELSLNILLSAGKIESVQLSPNDEQEDEFDCYEIWNSQK